MVSYGEYPPDFLEEINPTLYAKCVCWAEELPKSAIGFCHWYDALETEEIYSVVNALPEWDAELLDALADRIDAAPEAYDDCEALMEAVARQLHLHQEK